MLIPVKIAVAGGNGYKVGKNVEEKTEKQYISPIGTYRANAPTKDGAGRERM